MPTPRAAALEVLERVVEAAQLELGQTQQRQSFAILRLDLEEISESFLSPRVVMAVRHKHPRVQPSFRPLRTKLQRLQVQSNRLLTGEGSAGTFNTYPNLDTIAEFRISTSNYGADMGKHAGATIEVATKSGTREFHGDAFEYVRNDNFDANPWFQNRQIGPPNGHAPKTPRKWNDYGYTIGGPFYIPGHYNTDKTKTFFYWSQDWRKYREGQVVSSGVPSLLMRNGDFSQCDEYGAGGPKYGQGPPAVGNDAPYDANAASGCTLPTIGGVTYANINSIPGGLNQQGVTNTNILLDGLIPKSNNGVVDSVLSSSTATNWRQEQIRVDQNVNDKTRVFVRYTQDAWDTLAVPALWTWSNYDTVKTPFGGPGKSAVLNITRSFKPNLMNEFVMAYTLDHILLYPQAGSDSAGINRSSSFVANHFFAPNSGNPLLPSLVVCGGTPFCAAQDTGFYPWFNSNPIITWKDNVAWTRGTHTLKFGAFLEKYRKNEQFGTETQGAMYFDNWGSNTTGNALADMFLGRMQQYTEGTETMNGLPMGGYPKGHWRMTVIEPYFQDDWKVNHKLTLNLGLRYYWFTRIHDVTKPTVDSGFQPNLYNSAAEQVLDSSGNLIQDPNTTTLGASALPSFTAPGRRCP